MDNHRRYLDPLFHALADPTRRAVVAELGKGPASVSDLADPFPMGLPAFLKHITVLEEAGIIATRKQGRVRTCTLQEDRLAAAEAWFREQRDLWASRYDQLDDLLITLQDKPDET